MMKKTNKRILNTVLAIFGFIWISPFIFVLFGCVKSIQEYNLGNFWDLPKHISLLGNWEWLTAQISISNAFFNSLIYGIAGASIAIFLAILAAYSISTLKIKRKLLWFMLIYSGTIFPVQIYLIPIYKAYSFMGLYDTKIGLILFYSAICIPFSMFVLRNFFTGIPKEMLEAARIDGASDLRILFNIYMPMARAPVSAVFLFQFTWIWSDLLFGMTLSKSDGVRPIMATISMLLGQGAPREIPPVLLVCIIASIPTVIVFILLNKSLEKGFVAIGK